MLLVVISAVLSYRAYQFTDSVAFCGATCHTPMKPEYTAYQDSPHARVPCVGCHVGPGATWYVRSKLSGTYQVYAVFRDVYPRPITTPISDLRPVQQACEAMSLAGKILRRPAQDLQPLRLRQEQHPKRDTAADQDRWRKSELRQHHRNSLAHEYRLQNLVHRERPAEPRDSLGTGERYRGARDRVYGQERCSDAGRDFSRHQSERWIA